MRNDFLSVSSVTYGYSNRQNVFNDFSITFDEGKIIGLLGKNGTGKSTLLYLLCGLLHAQKGEVLFKNKNVKERNPETLQDIFIVPEEFSMPDTTLNKYIKLLSPFYPNFSYDDMKSTMDKFELDMNLNLKELSMGMKKKVFMCFALATNTSLLLMDEPTNGLDIPSKSQFRKVIASSMSDNRSIIISTHQVKDIDILLDKVVVLDNNDILLDQNVADITEKLYFAETGINDDISDAIFTQPSLAGYSAVFRNLENDESTMNLETLFNATLSKRDEIKKIFEK